MEELDGLSELPQVRSRSKFQSHPRVPPTKPICLSWKTRNAMESCGRKDAAGGSRCCALGVQSRPCAGDGEGVSGKSLLCLGPSILVTVTWACWSSGIPKAFGNGISIRFKGRCLARFRRLLLEEVSTKSCLTHGVTELNWLKAMRLLRKKGRLTCIAKEPHNFICSFLSTSKNTPVPFPFHGSVHFTSSEGTADVPSLNRNVRIRFVV